MKRKLLALALTAAAALTPAAEPPYEPTKASLSKHTAPQWFEDAKLGFFITWGAYSVPAYAPLDGSESKYAEWYWSKMNTKDTPTQKHHLAKYGADVDYDDFLDQWKAEKWDPKAWLNLFKTGGGKYYVLVAKHHDGIALWDSAVSDRTSVKLGPKRDFTRELVEANRAGGYGLKDGIYFSMPEWYNPSSPVQWGGWFGRGAPKNPYTGAAVPYTGYKPVGDYVRDFQLPQMKELVDKFDPDLIWCDIGGVNASNEFMAYYFNKAAGRKDVTINNRCGNGVEDFTTPEYSVEPDIKKSKWEASRGLGQSYGYNAEEGMADTLGPDELVDSFADIVSKNGNLLLNIGPKADGTVPELQASRVRALGQWLATNGEAMYGSRHWSQADDKGATVPVRFTTQPKAFYATALQWPGDKLTLTAPVPIQPGDEVKLLGDGAALKWTKNADGTLDISMPKPRGAYAYTFRIAKPGYNAATERLLGVEASAAPVKVGDKTTATVHLSNRGDKPIPAGQLLLRTPFDGGTKNVAFPRLAPHTRTTFTFEVQVPSGTRPGVYNLQVEAVSGSLFAATAPLKVVGETVPVDLSTAYDHDSIASDDAPNDGTFGNASVALPVDEIPAAGEVVYDKVRFTWPSGATGALNNIQANGQRVALPAGSYTSLQLLASAGYGPGESDVTVSYADGSSGTAKLTVADWMTGGDPPVFSTTHRFAFGQKADAVTRMYRYEIATDPAKQVVAVAIGKPTGPSTNTRTHVFAISAEKA